MPAPLSILITFGVIACLAVVLRWTYGSDASERYYPPPPGDEPGPPRVVTSMHDFLGPEEGETVPDDWATLTEDEGYGLLRTVLATADPTQVAAARALLRDSGIRCTVATRPDGRTAVLVFGEQLDQARRLVG